MLKTHISKFISFLILITLITSCRKPAKVLPTIHAPDITPTQYVNTAYITLTPSPTVKPKMTIIPTPTLKPIVTMSPSPTVSMTSSSTPIPVIEKCIIMKPVEQGNIMTKGSLLYQQLEGESILLLQARELLPKTLFDHREFLWVSPFTGTYAWYDAEGITHVRKPDGKGFDLNLGEHYYGVRQWLSNDNFIPYRGGQLQYQESYPAEDISIIVEPTTGKVTPYDIKMSGYFASRLLISLVVAQPLYDPTMSRAFYAWDTIDPYDEGMLMWDIPNGKVIWKQGSWSDIVQNSKPEWQLDGSHVVVSAPVEGRDNPLELASISTDGKVTPLTHLGKFSHYYRLSYPKWSPDGRYVAFIYTEGDQYPGEAGVLYIVDVVTGVVTNYCASSISNHYWSPTSDQLAFILKKSQLVVLDVKSAEAQVVADSPSLFGWVNWIIP